MATKTLAVAAALALSLAAPALADANLGEAPPKPTQIREWFRTDTAFVTESITSEGRHQCVLHINNGATSFGVVTVGSSVQIWLHDRVAAGFNGGYVRIQIDNYPVWRINGNTDTATPNMYLSENMS